MKLTLLRTLPARRGELGLFILSPASGIEVTVRAWRPDSVSPWRVLPNQGDGIVITQLGRILIEETLNQ